MIIKSDINYAFRLLAKSPGFTALTTLVMATGIGLSVYLFSFMNTMIFKDMPFDDGESLIEVSQYVDGQKNNAYLNLFDYQVIRENIKGLKEFGAYRNVSANVAGRDGARRYSAAKSEPNIFQITRTKPILGRGFTLTENQAGAEPVVVIGYDLWQNQFAGDQDAIGQMLRVNSISHRIIGVMPEGYFFPNSVELWLPMGNGAKELTHENAGTANGLAHLLPGYSMQDINQQLTVIMQRLEQQYPKTNTGVRTYIDTIQKSTAGDGITVVYSMYVAAILILILAAVNVGNLLLSRAVERSKETAIRMALGAPRARLVSQMLWESIIICSVGGIIGLLLVSWGLGVTETVTDSFNNGKPTFWFKFGLDPFTIKTFLLFVLGTILMTGLVPAWRNSSADFNTVLRDGTRGATGKKSGRLNRFLVISEIFLSMGILITASVIIVSGYQAMHADNGADTENALTARILLPETNYSDPEKKLSFVKTLQTRLENKTTIGNVMMASALPGQYTSQVPLAIEGREYSFEGNETYPKANYVTSTIGSLPKLGVELMEGRYFSSLDEGIGKTTAIVTESFVKQHFEGESAVGKRIRIIQSDSDELNWVTIVGVIEHTIHGRAQTDQGRAPSIYVPFSQVPVSQLRLALQMRADSQLVERQLRKTLQSIDPELPAFYVESYEANIARIIAPLRFVSNVFMLFGIAAVMLAASGIYGVMANTINQRTQEIGVKRALGAMDERITRELLMSGGKLLLWGGIPGALIGSGMGFAMSRVMGIDNTDLILITACIIVIIGSVVLLATLLPAKKALQMEPSEALHYE